jgi:phosphatidylglycerophosphate synthase
MKATELKKEGDEITCRIFRPFAIILATFLAKYTKITPNQVTFFSMLLLLMSALMFARGTHSYYIIGGVLAFLYLIFDLVDGELARRQNKGGNLGKWFDGVVGLIGTPLIILVLALSLKTYIALFIGTLAAMAFPMQFMLIYGFKVEIMRSSKRLKIPVTRRFDLVRHFYGISLFFPLLLFAALFNKPLVLLIFYATFGNLFWICILILQFLQLGREG